MIFTYLHHCVYPLRKIKNVNDFSIVRDNDLIFWKGLQIIKNIFLRALIWKFVDVIIINKSILGAPFKFVDDIIPHLKSFWINLHCNKTNLSKAIQIIPSKGILCYKYIDFEDVPCLLSCSIKKCHKDIDYKAIFWIFYTPSLLSCFSTRFSFISSLMKILKGGLLWPPRVTASSKSPICLGLSGVDTQKVFHQTSPVGLSHYTWKYWESYCL